MYRVLFLLPLLLVGCGRAAPAGQQAIPGGAGRGLRGVVTHVVDGDTVDVRVAGRGIERLRLVGIDTPETVKPNTPVQCYGPQASSHLKHLLPAGSRVRVERDAEVRDRYGRGDLVQGRRVGS